MTTSWFALPALLLSVRKSASHRGFPAESSHKILRFLCCRPERAAEQTFKFPLIWTSQSASNSESISMWCHDIVLVLKCPWWRHQMETFSALLAICAGNSPVPGEFPTQRPVTRSFDVYFDLRLNKRLCKQSCGWWFETLLCPLWRHSNASAKFAEPCPGGNECVHLNGKVVTLTTL